MNELSERAELGLEPPGFAVPKIRLEHSGFEAPSTTYGQHLTLRISNIERRSALDGADSVRELLTTLVRRIGMRILAGPLIGIEDGPPERRGVSGVVILFESHAAIHTYPEVGQAFLDVFSCKSYDTETVAAVLREFIGSFEIVEKTEFDRGVHWSTSVERELTHWHVQRN